METNKYYSEKIGRPTKFLWYEEINTYLQQNFIGQIVQLNDQYIPSLLLSKKYVIQGH
jgi:hypothetical protein